MRYDAEHSLASLVDDEKLGGNLRQIRAQVLRQLGGDDDTSPSAHHAEQRLRRMSHKIWELLQATPRSPLKPTEIYPLLGALYLDALGDRPDTEYPDAVLREAADLVRDYRSNPAADEVSVASYQLRPLAPAVKPFLAEAWIVFARRGGDTVLRTSLNAIQAEFVGEIRTICSLSRRLELGSHIHSPSYGNPERSRFLAALLQLARDLSGFGDWSAIPLELTSLSDQRLFERYSHNARMSLLDNGLIQLRVSLRPEDADTFRSSVEQVFVNPVVQRLNKILAVLRNGGLPLGLDPSPIIQKDENFPWLKDVPVIPHPPHIPPEEPGGTGSHILAYLVGLALIGLLCYGVFGLFSNGLFGWFTPTRAPVVAPAATPDPMMAVSDWFALLRQQRFSDAWNQLTPDCQNSVFETYDVFVNIWSNASDIKMQVHNATIIDSIHAEVEVGMRFVNVDSGASVEEPLTRLSLVYDPSQGHWLIEDITFPSP